MVEPMNPLLSGNPRVEGKGRRILPWWLSCAPQSPKGDDLCTGSGARLINISRGGALLETETRMTPGAIICLRLIAADAVFLLRGRVLQSRALPLRDSLSVFKSAVTFDGCLPCPVDDREGLVSEEQMAAALPENETPGNKPGRPTEAAAQKSKADTVTASIPPSGPDLRQIFELNK